MDPFHIVVRAAFAYVFALALIRVSGKRAVQQADTHSFVLAVIMGDLFDDLFWAEVPAAEFIVALTTLVMLHVLANTGVFASGQRGWRRSVRGEA